MSKKVALTEQYLYDIADAIRAKNGLTETYTPAEMGPAILDLGGGGIVPSGTINITTNGTHDVYNYANALVNVSSEAPTLQAKSVSYTPIEESQTDTVLPDTGYAGLSQVRIDVDAIDSNYIGSNISRNTSSDLSVSGATVTVPSGFYEDGASASVTTATHPKPTASINSTTGLVTASHTQTTGYVTGGTTTGTLQLTTQAAKTVTPSTSSQTAVAAGRYTTGAVSVAAVPTEEKTATTNGEVTPSSGKFLSKVTVNVPTGSTINNQNKSVTPTESSQEVTADSGYTGLGTVTVGAISSTYVGSDIAQRSSTNLSVSGATVTAPAGYYAESASKSVASGTAGTPSATKGTVSNHAISVTPSVTNTTGYITGGTKTGTAVSVSASELVSGTLSVTSNGTKDVTNYASVNVNISGDSPTIESLEITPSESEQTFNSSDVDGYKPVTVGAVSSTYVGSDITRRSSTDLTASGATVTVPSGYYSANASKSVASGTAGTPTATKVVDTDDASALITPSVTNTTGYITGGTKTGVSFYVTARELVSGKTAICDDAGSWDVAETETLVVPSGTAGTPTATKGTVSDHSVSVTPSVTNTTGYITGSTKTGTAVTVSASELVSGSETKTSNGTYDVTNLAELVVNVPSSSPTIQSLSITPSTSEQTFNASGVDGYKPVTVAAMPTMALPTSATTSPTSGYTSKATIGRSTNDQIINIPPGYNSAGAYYRVSAVANGSATAPASISGTSASISTGTNTLTLSKTVSVTPSVTAGYVSSGTAGNSSVSLTASVSVNPTPTVSGATVTIPSGYYSSQTSKSVSSGSASAPTSISGSTATVSTGTNTLTLTKTVSVTPVVSAGYVSSGTATNSSVSLTAAVTTKAATTYNTSTTDQTISSGAYLTGTQTIKAVTVSGLSADKILSGTTVMVGDSNDADRIASVSGSVVIQKYYTGSSAPSSSLGNNGDIYLQE